MPLPVHGWVGARATSFLVVHFTLQNTSPNSAEKEKGVTRAEAKPCRPVHQEQNTAKKFFPFRRRRSVRTNHKKRRKLFCGVASVSKRRRRRASRFAVRILFKKVRSTFSKSDQMKLDGFCGEFDCFLAELKLGDAK